MIAHFNRFVNNGAGLEKTLRLIQSVAQIAAVFSIGSTAVRLTTAKLQLALTRRFFRFFGFIESFQRVSALLSKEGMGSVPGWIDLAKWTCFGLYFVLEDLTILHAMGVYIVPWEERVMREANQFWFYALSLSPWRCLRTSLPFSGVYVAGKERSEERKSCCGHSQYFGFGETDCGRKL
ncbi:hypothetical protein N7526_004469 [Penicillium atrosanguineum]|nr:hypothetical protein N7526_004469 [Penicillium atrosanguineum]